MGGVKGFQDPSVRFYVCAGFGHKEVNTGIRSGFVRDVLGFHLSKNTVNRDFHG